MIIEIIKKSFNEDGLTGLYLKQLSSNTIVRILNILFSIIYVPIVLGYLEADKYGIWITITTVVNWLRLFDIGIGIGLRNKLTESLALKNFEKAKTLISTAYFLIGTIFFTLILIAFLINPLLNWNSILNTQLVHNDELRNIANVVISFLLLAFIIQTVNYIYEGHGNTAMGGFMQLISNIIALIIIWIITLTTTKGNLFLLALVFSATPVLVYTLFSFYTFIKKYPDLIPEIKFVDIKHSGDLIKLSTQFFIVKLTAAIIFSSIPFIIIQLFGPNEVTQFSIATTIFNLPILLMNLLTTPITPLVTKAYTLKNIHWLKNMLKKLNLVSVALSFLIILLIILSEFIYDFWIGNKIFIPKHLTIAIGFYTIIFLFNMPYATFINGIGKVQILVVLAPLGIILFLGGCFLFKFLLNDVVAISIALSLQSFIGLIFIPITLKKYLLDK